jgi:hypothetical protein
MGRLVPTLAEDPVPGRDVAATTVLLGYMGDSEMAMGKPVPYEADADA